MYLMKTELGIDTSINSTAKIFDVLEKKLRQGLKGVKYESGSQQKRQGSCEEGAQARKLHLVAVKMKELLLSSHC